MSHNQRLKPWFWLPYGATCFFAPVKLTVTEIARGGTYSLVPGHVINIAIVEGAERCVRVGGQVKSPSSPPALNLSHLGVALLPPGPASLPRCGGGGAHGHAAMRKVPPLGGSGKAATPGRAPAAAAAAGAGLLLAPGFTPFSLGARFFGFI